MSVFSNAVAIFSCSDKQPTGPKWAGRFTRISSGEGWFITRRAKGSSFDRWVGMGVPELGDADVEWLRQNSQPALHIHQTSAPRGELTYFALLAPHEVRLVEFSPAEYRYQQLT